ncbi:hypothetical protein RHOFW104T7_06460 [Rhodanobacter thiooxydans]|uniref:Uncharacterized protein n=1 Tax=Rhodanobacter thiooxydans TaxID=416169 RepID=A0A154QKT8_9GAMM|nr:ABC transporter permease [Rhodanobacter thiooxydans LCS2]KZC24833.1 hypothetical protein RHOFW104T7_06460 [Rhodanobacter thiooxydans]
MFLIIMEVALASSVVINTLHLLSEYIDHVSIQTGIETNEVAWLQSSGIASGTTPAAAADADLAALRRAPSVIHAAMVSALPLTNTSAYSFKVAPAGQDLASGATSSGMYFWGRGAMSALGVRLVSGRDFVDQEYVEYSFFGTTPPPASVLITRALATRLFGADNAVGKRIRLQLNGDPTAIVVGVIDRLVSPSLHYQAKDGFNVVFPVQHVPGGIFIVRARVDQGDAALSSAKAALYAINPSRILTHAEQFKVTESDYFRGDRSMVWTLSLLTGCLALLTAVGIVSISNYWVVQRRRSIGIRRALGARRSEIVQYFLVENLVIVLAGTLLGLMGAAGLNVAMMHWFEVSRLPVSWLPIGLILLLAIGQIAVLMPALQASKICPSVISGGE